jgi:hypothetical protein
MEDDLISKVKYLGYRLLDPTQILNLCLDDQTILYKSFKSRRHPVEDDIKILKVEYLSNRVLDHTQVYITKPYVVNPYEDDLLWQTTSKS